ERPRRRPAPSSGRRGRRKRALPHARPPDPGDGGVRVREREHAGDRASGGGDPVAADLSGDHGGPAGARRRRPAQRAGCRVRVKVDRIDPEPPDAMSVEGTGDPQEHLGKRAASGFLWLAAQKWAVRVSGFATLVVLTHQISPHDFGVVAAAMTVIPIVYLLADLGFSTYLLQTDDIDEESLSTAFWTSVAAAVVLSSGLMAVAPLMAMAFHIAELARVLQVLVLAVVPTVLAGVPLALLRRNM